jgi:hypothetical protein
MDQIARGDNFYGLTGFTPGGQSTRDDKGVESLLAQ